MDRSAERPKEHEGERYLRLLGLEHLAGQSIVTAGRTIQARDFLEICGTQARPVLRGFEVMSKSDPRYEATKSALRGLISQYIEKS